MTAIQFRSPLVIPILPYGAPDQGYATARVTSPFGERSDGFHGGLDIGNERLGDTLVAVAGGVVAAVGNLGWPWSEPTTRFPSGNFGGLMVVLRHGPAGPVKQYPAGAIAEGVYSIYAHMRMVTVTRGQAVTSGQKIGEIGDSGSAAPPPLGGGGHVHFGIQAPIGMVPSSVRWVATYLGIGLDVDPWPLINGVPLGEDDVQYPRPMFPLALVTIGAGNNLRRTPSLTAEAKLLTVEATAGLHGVTAGEAWLDKGTEWLWVGYQKEMWCIHSALVTNLRPTVTLQTLGLADCTAQVTAAREATASKAEAQVQAWVATRPPITP